MEHESRRAAEASVFPRRRSSTHNLLLHCVLKTGGKDEAISRMCLQRFYLSSVVQRAPMPVCYICEGNGETFLNLPRSAPENIPNETWLQSAEHILVLLLHDSKKRKRAFRFDVLVILDSSDSLSPEALFLRSLWIGRRGASQVDLSGGIQFRQVIWGGTLQPKWLFFSRSPERFQS